jgi:Tol biopolymer transport system component/DNA-binding winged helix-turn-helix (wHTH) protein
LRIGEFELDPVAKVLFRDGQPVGLTRKATEMLLALARRAGQVVTKEELMAEVWPDRVVDEANLAQNIAVVRKALGVAKGHPASIETFAGRGYRMEGPVGEDPLEGLQEATPTATSKRGRGWIWAVAGLAFLLATVAFWWSARSTTVQPTIVKLTRMPGRESHPALSHDGKWLAFIASGSEQEAAGLYVQKTEGGQPRLLLRAAALLSSPVWEPDLSAVNVLRMARDETVVERVRLADGKVERRQTWRFALPGEPYRMLEMGKEANTWIVASPVGESRRLGLVLVDANGAARVLTQPTADTQMDVEPRLSPNGKAILFVRVYHRSRQELFRLDLGSGSLQQLTNDGRQLNAANWSRDGASVYFSSDRHGEFRLWSMASTGGAAKALPVYGEFPIQFAIARQSDELVYAAQVEDRNIWRLDLVTKTWTPVANTTGQDASPRYSPDGKRICFRSDRSGSEQLWVADANGANAVAVTSDPLRASVGNWSPDGKAIVFNDPLTREVYLAREVAPRQWAATMLGVKGIHPVFAGNGDAIALATSEGIEYRALAGQERRMIAKVKASALSVDPMGKRLFFVPDGENTALHAVDLSGGSSARLVGGLVPGCTSCYAVGAEGVYFLTVADGEFFQQTLAYRDARSGKISPVLVYPEPLWPQGSGPFSLSPDGKSLLVVRVDPRPNSDVLLVRPF